MQSLDDRPLQRFYLDNVAKSGMTYDLIPYPQRPRCVALASGTAVTTPRSEDAAGTVCASTVRLFIPDFATLPTKKGFNRYLVCVLPAQDCVVVVSSVCEVMKATVPPCASERWGRGKE